MNAIINTLSLAGDNFMPKIHLRQRGFTYSACGPFTKKKKKEYKKNKKKSRRCEIYLSKQIR